MKLTHGDLHLLLNRARSAPNAKAVAQAVLLASVVLGGRRTKLPHRPVPPTRHTTRLDRYSINDYSDDHFSHYMSHAFQLLPLELPLRSSRCR